MPVSTEDTRFEALTKKAKKRTMTTLEWAMQRRSWAEGELAIQYPNKSQAEIEELVDMAILGLQETW